MDISRIETEAEKQVVVEVMEAAAPIAEANGVELHLETDLGPEDFAALLQRVSHPYVKANYDSGNSSGWDMLRMRSLRHMENGLARSTSRIAGRNFPAALRPCRLAKGLRIFRASSLA